MNKRAALLAHPSALDAPRHGEGQAVPRAAYRIAEFSAALGISKTAARDLIRRGLVRAVFLGEPGVVMTSKGIQRRKRGLVLIPASELARLLGEVER